MLQPFAVLSIRHPVPPPVFRHINFISIYLDAKRKLRKVVIIKPVATHTHAPRLPPAVAVEFLEAVYEGGGVQGVQGFKGFKGFKIGKIVKSE